MIHANANRVLEEVRMYINTIDGNNTFNPHKQDMRITIELCARKL